MACPYKNQSIGVYLITADTAVTTTSGGEMLERVIDAIATLAPQS